MDHDRAEDDPSVSADQGKGDGKQREDDDHGAGIELQCENRIDGNQRGRFVSR
jgi:hypothetical protein